MKIREATIDDARGIGMVHVDAWRSTYTGLVPNNLIEELSYEKDQIKFEEKINHLTKDQFILVAETQKGKIVGFAQGGEERSGEYHGFGELNAIYVLESFQGKGIGKELFDNAITLLKTSGFNKMIIWVLDGNKYEKFYTKLGGLPFKSLTKKFGDETLKLKSFTWDI